VCVTETLYDLLKQASTGIIINSKYVNRQPFSPAHHDGRAAQSNNTNTLNDIYI
jgi:hypothetical protein